MIRTKTPSIRNLLGDYTALVSHMSPTTCREPGCGEDAVYDGYDVLCRAGHMNGNDESGFASTNRSRELGAHLVLMVTIELEKWAIEDEARTGR